MKSNLQILIFKSDMKIKTFFKKNRKEEPLFKRIDFLKESFNEQCESIVR